MVVCIRSAENSHFSIQHKNLVTSRSLCCNQHKQTDICSVFDPMNVVYILLLVCSSFTIIQKTLNWGPCYFPSLLDYCNALLSGALVATFDKLQRSQNNLTRVVCQSRRRTDARPLLHSLHWLPVRQRVTYKLAVLTHKVRTTATATYLSELVHCAVPMLRCSSFFAYTPNWPVALFLLLLHPPGTLYLLTFDCAKTFSLSNAT